MTTTNKPADQKAAVGPKKPAGTAVELYAPIQDPNSVEKLFAQYRQAFEAVAPQMLDINRMMRVAIMTASRSKDLLRCTGISLLGAFMTALQLGLDFGLGEAHLVPFKNKYNEGKQEVQLIPDYKGLIKLARNSGEISDIWARLVYKGEKFRVVEGMDPILTHEPNIELQGDPKNIVAAYTITVWKDGRRTFEVINRKKIERAKSSSASKDSGPWGTDYDEMALKTAFKHRCKTLPRSPQMAQAIALDDRAEMARPQNISLVTDERNGTTAAFMGPDPDESGSAGDGNGGETRQLVSTNEQGKFRAWMKKYKWTDEQAVAMLKEKAKYIDFAPQEIAGIVCQIDATELDDLILELEKGPGGAADEPDAAASKTAEGKDAKTESAGDKNGENKIDDDTYNEIWTKVTDLKIVPQTKEFAKTTLGAGDLKSVKRKDLGKLWEFINKHNK